MCFLSLSDNKIIEFPKKFEYSQLTYLNLANNKLCQVIDDFSKTSNLEMLFLEGNNLTSLSSSIGQLQKLQNIWLENNQLTEFPLALQKCGQLTFIGLANNNITHFEDNITGFHNLNHLSIQNNQLTTRPSSLANISNLNYLQCDDNKISTLPNIFDQFESLQSLYLENNKLTELPSSLLEGYKNTISALYLDQNDFQVSLFKVFFSQSYEELTLPNLGEEILSTRKTFNKLINKKKINAKDRVLFYHILSTPIDKLETLPFESFFKALQTGFHPLQNNVLSYLHKGWKDKLKDSPFHEKSHVAVLGKVNFNKMEFRKRLKKIGITYTTKITDKTTHVIIGKDIIDYKNFDHKGLVFLPDQALQEYLNKVDALYLNNIKTPTDEVEHVKSFLISIDENSVNIGLEMLKTLGIPKDIITELFLVHKNTLLSTKVRNKAKKFLLLNCSDQLKENLANHNRSAVISKQGIYYAYYNLKDLTLNTELDLKKIIDYVTLHLKQYYQPLAKLLKDPKDNFQYIKGMLEHHHDEDIHIDSIHLVDASMIFELPKKYIKKLTINSIEDYNLIQDKLYTLSALEYLSFGSLGLSSLPPKFEQLQQLKELILFENQFEKFPQEIENMVNLRSIHISSNPFTKDNTQQPNEDVFELRRYPYFLTRK